jgi:RNA polymerase sigma-70 factor (ECF subfamily)
MVSGDEDAFTKLIECYHPRLLRLANSFVSSHQVAEDVVQETWIAVLHGIAGLQGRSAFRSWLFQICVNQAKSAARREARIVLIDPADLEVTHDFAADGSWAVPPRRWAEGVDAQADSSSPRAERARQAIDDLPPTQRQVVTMRDVEGLTPAEVSDLLSISDVNQRVILHRGRSRVRRALAQREQQ